ncbi:hypothetical protein ACFU99_06180 [Streptomyces sp. NPDC057654]|uniref:hypothetical protein n=1 Tax=Streptomyces sp. NPDC057654 TaxID=3346196 RepID=UPI0036A97204
MIAALFNPLDIECLAKTAVELWENPDPSDLSEYQRDNLSRARHAMLAEHADQQPPYPEVVTFISSRPVRQVLVLRRWDRDHDDVTLHDDKNSALDELAEYIRGVWHKLAGAKGVPDQPPTDNCETVRLYYGPDGDCRQDEGYVIYTEEITRRGRTRIVPLDYRFPNADTCEKANRNATFHPQTDNNDLPCVEVEGVLVFAYLDQEADAVRVSVHLDSAEDQLVRPDGTVPLRVEVGDAVVLDDSAEGTPKRDLLTKLLDAADDSQE